MNLMTIWKNQTPIRKLLKVHMIAGGVPILDYTVTGNPVAFLTNVAKPLGIVAAFSPVQAGSGDPSPENVRPITGWSGATIYRSGKNLFDKSTAQANKVWYNGRTYSGYPSHYASTKIPVVPGVVYILTRDGTGASTVCFFDRSGNYVSSITTDGGNVTIPANCYFIAFSVYKPNIDEAQLEVGKEATAYADFVSLDYFTVSFPAEAGTVYGGTLDITTGVLTVEWVGFDFVWKDGVNEAAVGTTITMRRFTVVDNITTGSANNACNVAPYSSSEKEEVHFYYAGQGAGKGARVFLPNGTDGDTQIRIISKRPSPLVYQLTPTEILSLIGNNVLWSDLNGNLTVKYKKKG